MDDIANLARQLEREKILRARAMTVAEKFRAGAELFEDACDITRSGIRSRHPSWDKEEIERELLRRLEIGRRNEEALTR